MVVSTEMTAVNEKNTAGPPETASGFCSVTFSGRHEGTGDKRLSSLVTRSLNNSSLKTSWKSLMQSVTNLHLVQIIFYAASNFESQGLRDMNLFFPGYYRGIICKTKIFTVYTVVI